MRLIVSTIVSNYVPTAVFTNDGDTRTLTRETLPLPLEYLLLPCGDHLFLSYPCPSILFTGLLFLVVGFLLSLVIVIIYTSNLSHSSWIHWHICSTEPIIGARRHAASQSVLQVTSALFRTHLECISVRLPRPEGPVAYRMIYNCPLRPRHQTHSHRPMHLVVQNILIAVEPGMRPVKTLLYLIFVLFPRQLFSLDIFRLH